MTLRFRLLLVYLIVVGLSVATVGVAVFQLGRSGKIIRELQDWNAIVLNVEKLKSRSPLEVDLRELLAPQYLYLADLASPPDYLDVDRVRLALNAVHHQYEGYESWHQLPPGERERKADLVSQKLAELADVLEGERQKLNHEANKQDARTQVLLVVVIALTIVHVAVIGSLLRRWLLRPMEQLNRQVEALARDEPAPEPLLNSPREMASLAEALDRARRSLGTLRQQLLESERLTTIGQLAAQLAHNLRNPLASIRAAAQLTGRHEPDDPDARRRMDDIVASVDRMDRWIAGLMEIAKQQPTRPRETDVVPALARAREALRPELAAKELELTIAAPDEGLICAHDPATLEHALIAMIVNAIEASPLGETIELRAERLEHPGQARPPTASGRQARQWCRISVRDHGSGLPPEAPERIFEFSYSTKQRGMGLGLALARQALQRQGGLAHAINNPEGGATIYVELPMEEERIENGEWRIES